MKKFCEKIDTVQFFLELGVVYLTCKLGKIFFGIDPLLDK